MSHQVIIGSIERIYIGMSPIYEMQLMDIYDPDTGAVIGQELQPVQVGEEEKEIHEWIPEIPFDQFPPGHRDCVPNPNGPGYIWIVTVDD